MAVQGLWRQGKDNVLYFNCGGVRLPPASLMIRTWLANALAMGWLMIYVSLLVAFCKILLVLLEAFCSLLGLFLRL